MAVGGHGGGGGQPGGGYHAGGGGGSGYAAPGTTNVPGTAGTHGGNGQIVLAYSLPSATVSFNSEGGNLVAHETIAKGGAAMVPTLPTRTSYGFDGWFTSDSGGSVWDFTTPVVADVTLYAQWTVITPTAAISAPTVVQDGKLVVSGADFPASQTLDISIHSSPVHLATVTTDINGPGRSRYR